MVSILDLHFYLRGLPSHASQDPFLALHSIIPPIEGWRPAVLPARVVALKECSVSRSALRLSGFALTKLLNHMVQIRLSSGVLVARVANRTAPTGSAVPAEPFGALP